MLVSQLQYDAIFHATSHTPRHISGSCIAAQTMDMHQVQGSSSDLWSTPLQDPVFSGVVVHEEQPHSVDLKHSSDTPQVLTPIPVVILHKEAALVAASFIIHNAQHIFPHPQGLHAPAHNPHNSHSAYTSRCITARVDAALEVLPITSQ